MSRRTGLTLLELLVVIGIIGALLGVLLPAVQKVRAAAARAQCQNNLKQLGLAAHMHHLDYSSFPSGMAFQDPRFPCRLASWLTQLLPYVEQDALAANTRPAYRLSPSPFNNPPHRGLSTVVRVFGCPADGRVDTAQRAWRTGQTVALTSYLGVSGLDWRTNDGVLFRDSAVRIADIADGTSQTLFAGERPPSPDFQFGWWYAGAGQQFTGSADSVLGVRERNILSPSITPCPPVIYDYRPGIASNPCDIFHFWSFHSGGANFLLADGSVRFLPYSAAPLMPALASRAGGEVVAVE